MSDKFNPSTLLRVDGSGERRGNSSVNTDFIELLERQSAVRAAACQNSLSAARFEDPRGIRDADRADNSQTTAPVGVAAIALANGDNTANHGNISGYEVPVSAQSGYLETYPHIPSATLADSDALVARSTLSHLDQARAMVDAAREDSSQLPEEMPGYIADNSADFGPELTNSGRSNA